MLIGQKSGRTGELCSSFRDGWQLGPAVAAQGPLSAAAGAVFRPLVQVFRLASAGMSRCPARRSTSEPLRTKGGAMWSYRVDVLTSQTEWRW